MEGVVNWLGERKERLSIMSKKRSIVESTVRRSDGSNERIRRKWREDRGLEGVLTVITKGEEEKRAENRGLEGVLTVLTKEVEEK